ncbi:MAG: DoxX family protein [Bacteroidota bacterium]
MESILFLVARALFGGYFVFNALNHFRQISMMTGYAQSKGVPAPKLAVAFTGLLLLIGGMSVLFGIYPIVGAAALVLFLVPVTFKMHTFWKVPDPQAKMFEMVNFTKNLALVGGALLLLSIPQPWPASLGF